MTSVEHQFFARVQHHFLTILHEMTDGNQIPLKDLSQSPHQSKPPSSPVNQVIISSRHPHTADLRSPDGSNSSGSRRRSTLTGRSSIQMEPGIQLLLAAEGRAAELIARARVKRNDLIRQANQESQIETEAFRQERENQYQIKLQEATQLEKYRMKLNEKKCHLLEEMEKNVKKEEHSLVDWIVHCVIGDIPVKPHRNAKHQLY